MSGWPTALAKRLDGRCCKPRRGRHDPVAILRWPASSGMT